MIREPAQNKKLPLTQLTSGKKGYSRWSRDREWLACPTPVPTRARVHHSLSRTSSIATGDETTMHAPMCTVLMATYSDPKSPTHDYWSTLAVAACTCLILLVARRLCAWPAGRTGSLADHKRERPVANHPQADWPRPA